MRRIWVSFDFHSCGHLHLQSTDRASPSITADPIVQLRACKQPGNDGVLQLVQQQWLINIHIPLRTPFDAYLCLSHISNLSNLIIFISAWRTWSVYQYLMRTLTCSLTMYPSNLLVFFCCYLENLTFILILNGMWSYSHVMWETVKAWLETLSILKHHWKSARVLHHFVM